MKNIISIPKSLYLVQMLIQGKFSTIKDEDINKGLDLFDFNDCPICIIPIEYLKSAIKYGLIDTSISDVDEKLDNSQKILKKLK